MQDGQKIGTRHCREETCAAPRLRLNAFYLTRGSARRALPRSLGRFSLGDDVLEGVEEVGRLRGVRLYTQHVGAPRDKVPVADCQDSGKYLVLVQAGFAKGFEIAAANQNWSLSEPLGILQNRELLLVESRAAPFGRNLDNVLFRCVTIATEKLSVAYASIGAS